MTYKPVSIPSLPVNTDPQMRQFLSSIKESLEVRLNQRGNALDSSPTFQDLLDTGILKIKDGVTTIGGKQYTADQLLGLVQYSLPNWITSDTAPPAPTGLAVSTDNTSILLNWDASGFDAYAQTEIWRAGSNNLSLAELVGSTSGNTYIDGLPDPTASYYYWIRDVSYNFLTSPYNAVSGTTVSLGPSAVTVAQEFVDADVAISWSTPTSNLAVSLYRIEQYIGGTWQLFDTVAGNAYRFKVTWGGAQQFRVIAVDINNNESAPATFTVTVVSHTAPAVTNTFNGEQVVLTWEASTGSLPVDYYEVYDTSVSTATLLSRQYSTVYRNKVLWLNKTFLVRSVDTAGNVGTTRSVPVVVSTGVVSTLASEVIDNNVFLRWTSAQGSLPIRTFFLRRGATWDTATDINDKSGGFTVLFEAPQAVTTFTYWLAAVDTAGNYGIPVSVTATVSQPPDYVLATNYVSTFAGTKSNAKVDLTGSLILPINTTETWSTHFSSRSWATPDAQVAAGYPVFIQPGTTTGYYEEVFDYGATLAAMKVTVSYLLTTVAGTLSSAVTITTALDSGFTSNVQTFSGAQAYSTNFRYVKFRVAVTATDDKGIGSLSNLTLKLDTKLKSQTGSITAVSDQTSGTYSQAGTVITITSTSHGRITGQEVRLDFSTGGAVSGAYVVTSYTANTFTVTASSATTSGNVTVNNAGTIVYLTEDRTSTGVKTFIDVESITVAASSTTPLFATYDFVDTYSPLSFKVLLFNSSGTRVSGTVSYQVRGY